MSFEERVQAYLEEFRRECEEDGVAIWEDRLYTKACEAALDEIAIMSELAKAEAKDG